MKNRKLGKILLVALFAMLFAALLAVNVSAEEPAPAEVANEAVLITADNQTTVYSTVPEALAAAVDGDVIEIRGTHKMADVNINATVTFKGNGTVTGPSTLHVANGKNVTFAESGVWNNCRVLMYGNNVVTYTDNVVFESTYRMIADASAAPTTVKFEKNAKLSTSTWFFDYNTSSETPVTKTVLMDGGWLIGQYIFVHSGNYVKPVLELKNGKIESTKNVFHFNIKNHATVDNTPTITMENMEILCAQHIFAIYQGINSNITVKSGTYTTTGASAAINFSGATTNLVHFDLQGGTYSIGAWLKQPNVMPQLTIKLSAEVAKTVNYADTMPNGAHIQGADGSVVSYHTLAAAVAAAKSGDTIRLTGAHTVAATVTVDKDLTVIGVEGATVTASGSLFNVKSGAKLTLGGYTTWTSGSSCITVGEGGAHIVFTDAVKVTNAKGTDDSAGALVLDKNDNTDTTIEVLKNKDIDGEPVLSCTGWGFDFEKATGNNTSGKKTVKVDCGNLSFGYFIVFNIGGVTADIDLSNATTSAIKNYFYFNNAYVAANDNVSTITLTNVTITTCTAVLNTQADCRINMTVNGGSFTSTDRVFNIDKAGSVIDLTINGGTFVAKNYAIYSNTKNDSKLTITGDASFKGTWFLVTDGLLCTSIADTVKVVEGTGNFASARIENADGTVTYGSLSNVVAYAPAGAIIDVDGVPTINNVQIDKDLTFTGIGTVTGADGKSLFTVKNGAKVTFSGSTVWAYNAKGVVVGEGGAHIVITDTVKFSTTSGGQDGAAIYDELGDVNTTVEILKSDKGAPTLESAGWTIDFEGDDKTPYATTKKINITGGTFSGSHPIVYNVGGVTADVSVKDASFTAKNEIVYINNNYFETAGADGKGNVGTFVLENVTANCNHFVYGAGTGAHANITVTGGNITTGTAAFKPNGSTHVWTVDIDGGTYTCNSQFLNSGNATGTYTIENATINAVNRVVSIHYDGNYDLTFTNCTVSAGERVYAFHDTSESTLTLHGGTHTLTNTTDSWKFVVYISGSDSLINLTADRGAQLISNNSRDDDATGTLFTRGGGAKMVANIKDAYIRGAYAIRASQGTLDLTLENTIVEVIGTGTDNYNGRASAIFLAGNTAQHKIHLKKGAILRPMDDDTLNPNRGMNGINLREVSLDLTIEEGAQILADGFGIKNGKSGNNYTRLIDSTITINGGIITGGNDVAIGFWARSTDANKPTTLTINGGSFSSTGGAGLWAYTDQNACLVNIHGGSFHSVDANACYMYSDGGHAIMNIYGGTFITENNDAALYVYTKNNDLTDTIEATMNVYGGYYEGHNLCAARASYGGVLNVWGGTFRFANDNPNHWGAPIRSGTGSNVGTVHIWGGNYYTTNTAASGLFTCMNDKSTLTVHGGFNGIGGRVIFEDYNSAVNGGTIVHELGTQVANHSIYMIDGAAVRLASGSNGLRFKSVVSAEAMAYINSIADAGSVKFGTVIVPADYLTDTNAFTAAELERLGLNYLDLKAETGLVQNADGSYSICAAITNIKEENIDRNFAATSYVEYTIDGIAVRVYSNHRELKNQRSIAQVARIALTNAGKYTEAQREVLALYAPDEAAPVIDIYLVAGQSNGAGCTNFTADFAASEEEFLNGYSNVLYHGVSVGGSTYAGKYIYENVPVKIGYGCAVSDFGPELGMAKALSQYYNEETGRMAAIVKYAYGGTGLADTISGQNFPEGSWCPPSWLEEHGKVDEYKSGGLYRAFVAQIQSAISDYRALGYEVNVIGGYWMQGCNDRTKDPNTYAAMYECWLSDLREDVYAITGDEADLKLPMVVGEICDYFNDNYYTENKLFTQMQREQIGALENVYVINNSTIPTVDHSNDKAHWDAHSALWIGENVGITYLTEILGSEYVVTDEDLVAEITLGGEVIGRYDSLVGAINDAPDGATIELKKDLTLYSTLAIGNRNQITLNGNGHKIDFVLPASENHTSMIIWYDTNMTVNDLHIKQNATNAWGTQLRRGADVTWNGGSIDATQFCFVTNTDDTNLTINGGSFSVSDGKWDYSAIIYFGNYSSTLTVTDGTFVANGLAVGVRISDKVLATITGGDWTVNGGDYVLELLGTGNILVIDKENVTLNGGKLGDIYNVGEGHVEDDGEGDIFG